MLLAGGKSRRMGRDKATIEWRGRPLWQWQIEKLCVLRAEKIFLSTQSDVPWRPADVEIVLDTPPSRGPLSGLAAALVATETNHLLSLAEMPICLQHVSGCLRRLVYASVDSFKQAIHLLALGFAGLSVCL